MLVPSSVVGIVGEFPADFVALIGCSVMAVVGVDLAVPGAMGRRPIDGREVIETREARDPERIGEGIVGVCSTGW